MEIIFATHNHHKVAEVNELFKDSQVIFRSLSEIDWSAEIIESGSTMKENAWIKTDTVYDQLGGNVISDDSGLEIDALDGAPGVISARFAGQEKDDLKNLNKALRMMDGISNRKARFRAVLALIFEGERYTFEGIVEGRLTTEARGSGGFGYYPIFMPDGYNDTFGELSSSIKNQISHRARAFEQLKRFLESHS